MSPPTQDDNLRLILVTLVTVQLGLLGVAILLGVGFITTIAFRLITTIGVGLITTITAPFGLLGCHGNGCIAGNVWLRRVDVARASAGLLGLPEGRQAAGDGVDSLELPAHAPHLGLGALQLQ